jgi:hypothetical protein
MDWTASSWAEFSDANPMASHPRKQGIQKGQRFDPQVASRQDPATIS